MGKKTENGTRKEDTHLLGGVLQMTAGGKKEHGFNLNSLLKQTNKQTNGA
jgi:hypothetical protein